MGTLTKTYVADWSDESVWITRTPSELARETFFYVQEVGRFFCRRRYYTEHEGIHSYLMLLTLDGAGTFRADGQEHALAAGDLVFTDCGRRHTYGTRGDSWTTIWTHFNGPCAPGYHQLFAASGQPVAHLDEASRLPGLLASLLEACQKGAPSCELEASQILTSILTSLLLETGAVLGDRSSLPSFVREALKDMDAHLRDDLSLDHFARTLSMDKFHFQKEFRRHVGMTPNEYVRRARVDCAKTLLASTSLPVAEIAEQSGFRTIASFNQTFRKLAGMTPTAYRRSVPMASAVTEESR